MILETTCIMHALISPHYYEEIFDLTMPSSWTQVRGMSASRSIALDIEAGMAS